MGKIKGWKKTKDTKGQYPEVIWEADFNEKGIGEYIRIRKEDTKWHLFIYGGNSIGFPHYGGVHITELHPTKAQAITYAMKYMRSHPNG